MDCSIYKKAKTYSIGEIRTSLQKYVYTQIKLKAPEKKGKKAINTAFDS